MMARRRATLALIACMLWMIGVEIAPRVYMACHVIAQAHRQARAHDGGGHDGDGGGGGDDVDAEVQEHFASRQRDADDDDDSGGAARVARLRHDHHAEPRLAPAHPRARELVTSELGTFAAPPPLALAPVDRRVTKLPEQTIATLIAASTPTAAARGPPTERALRRSTRIIYCG